MEFHVESKCGSHLAAVGFQLYRLNERKKIKPFYRSGVYSKRVLYGWIKNAALKELPEAVTSRSGVTESGGKKAVSISLPGRRR